jgi:hypothetical protein
MIKRVAVFAVVTMVSAASFASSVSQGPQGQPQAVQGQPQAAAPQQAVGSGGEGNQFARRKQAIVERLRQKREMIERKIQCVNQASRREDLRECMQRGDRG